MHIRKLAASATLLCGLALGAATSSPAYALCDAYSGGCATPPPTRGPGTDIGGGNQNPGTGPGTGGKQEPSTEKQKPGTDNETDTGAATKPDADAGGGGVSPADTTSQPRTLPFTGGELVLMSALGAGALAGGTALVVAGRRKARPAA